MIVLLSLTIGTAAAASTTKALSTNFTLINMSATNAAEVQVQYLKDDGTAWDAADANEIFSIPANYGQIQVRQYFDTIMSAGRGSAVVSSSEELAAVAQIQARGQVPTQGAYSGYNAGSAKFYVPLAAKLRATASGTANSQIIIQNVESSSAVDVTVNLVNNDGTIEYSKQIVDPAAGVSYYYDLADELDANLAAGWIGSAEVVSVGGNVAVVSSFFTGPDTMQTFNAFPEESLGPKWIAPLFFERLANGLSTVVTVQNLSGGTIAAGGITLNCTKNPNNPGPDMITASLPTALGNTASYSFNPVTDTTMFPDAGWGGSCRIDAGTANVVAIVQMRYVNAPNNFAGAAAYEAIPEGGSDDTLIIPLVAKRLPNGFASVAIIQNLDFVNAATVHMVYTPAVECALSICDINKDGKLDDLDVIVPDDAIIPAGGSIQRNHRLASGAESETLLPDGWQGSLVVTSDHAVSGFVQLTNIASFTGDTFMAHTAFTQMRPD
jgi:hypothetical protein